jgi:hypothetical protein
MTDSNEEVVTAKQKAPSLLLHEQWFALIAFVVGFLFWRWLLIVMAFGFQGWGMTLFTVVYVAAVSWYFRSAGVRQNTEARLWLAVVLATAMSFAVWNAQTIAPWRFLFLFGAATYWVVMATGNTAKGKTSDWSVLDFLNGIIAVPFLGLGLQYRSLAGIKRPGMGLGRKAWPSLLGLGLGLIFISLVMPLLSAADAGGFGEAWRWLSGFRLNLGIPPLLKLQLVLGIPTAAYIFALVVGNKLRGIERQDKAAALPEAGLAGYRLMPVVTAATLLAVINTLYLAFIVAQLPYFFSAFVGRLPENWVSVAEFARQGFFELCVVAVLNLGVITAVRLGTEAKISKSVVTQAMLSLLSLLTLLLIGTAFSKLWLYIDQFGLTMMRVKPAAVLTLLAVVFFSLVLGEKFRYSRVRLAVATGVLIMLAFSWLNVEGFVANYNATRYLDGTLSQFDVGVLYQVGIAGVPVAARLLASTDNLALQALLRGYLSQQRESDRLVTRERELGYGLLIETWQRRRVRELMTDVEPHVTLDEVLATVARSSDAVARFPNMQVMVGNRLMILEQVEFPYAAFHAMHAEETDVLLMDLRDGTSLLQGQAVQELLRKHWAHLVPSDSNLHGRGGGATLEVLRLFGLSPDGEKLGLLFVGRGGMFHGMGLVGFFDLATMRPHLMGMANFGSAFAWSPRWPTGERQVTWEPQWSPNGQYIKYGNPGFVFDDGSLLPPYNDPVSTLYIDCVSSKERIASISGEQMLAQLFPDLTVTDFKPWIRQVTWEADGESLRFRTVAVRGVEDHRYRDAALRQRVRQELGEAEWRVNADGSDLRLLSLVRPE